MQSADKNRNISPEMVADILVSEGEVTEDQIKEAWDEYEDEGSGIGELLISLGYITAEELARTLTRKLGVQYVVLSREEIDSSVRGLVEDDVLVQCGAVPLRMRNGKLVVAMKNPGDDKARSCVVESAGSPIVPVAAAEDAIRAVRNRLLKDGQFSNEDETTKRNGAEDEIGASSQPNGSASGNKTTSKLGSKKVGDILVSEGKITREQLEEALESQEANSKYLGVVLLELGYIDSSDLAQALARRYNTDYVVLSELSPGEADSEVIDSVDESTLRKYNALPLRYENDYLVVADERSERPVCSRRPTYDNR